MSWNVVVHAGKESKCELPEIAHSFSMMQTRTSDNGYFVKALCPLLVLLSPHRVASFTQIRSCLRAEVGSLHLPNVASRSVYSTSEIGIQPRPFHQ